MDSMSFDTEISKEFLMDAIAVTNLKSVRTILAAMSKSGINAEFRHRVKAIDTFVAAPKTMQADAFAVSELVFKAMPASYRLNRPTGAAASSAAGTEHPHA